VTTVGVIVGLMFLFSAVQQFILAAITDGAARWLEVAFGVLLAAAGIIALINPKSTFAGIADILGFLFLIVAATRIVQALVERDTNDLWWLGLIAGILMGVLAFWTRGQFLVDKAHMLLGGHLGPDARRHGHRPGVRGAPAGQGARLTRRFTPAG
jgi:hypothetical protein